MVQLGSIFPEALRERAIDNKLAAGSIIKVVCDFIQNPKPKYLLVLCAFPEPIAFVINSEINQFIAQRPAMAKCQVLMEQSNYPFLDHDSYINCVETKTERNIGNLRSKVLADIDTAYHGRLLPETLDEVIAATKFSQVLNNREKTIITGALGAIRI